MWNLKSLFSGSPETESPPAPLPPELQNAYQEAIAKTAAMVRDQEAQDLARQESLQILNITWEDTARYKDSSVGPNISDMTIQVEASDSKSGKLKATCMPVIRYPNFSDTTADLDPRNFTLLVGNQAGQELKRISLYDFLDNPTAYLTNINSWAADKKTLLCERDSQVLCSAQACFLPVPQQGKATFNPVIFNYQSRVGDPAVLTVLATREGTSVTIIDNKRDAFESGGMWGQRLFHNANGERASLTGERESEFRAAQENIGPTPTVSSEAKDKHAAGLNMVLLIQIPLKQKNVRPDMLFGALPPPMAIPAAAMMRGGASSDVENAVIGHGDLEGPFTEIDNLEIERDDRYPVRVTVQFYKATSNGVVNPLDLNEIKAQIDKVYSQSDYVGSLVTAGETGRITEYAGVKVQPPDWWEKFWQHHEAETGDDQVTAIKKLQELLDWDDNYQQQPVSELYLRSVLRQP